MSVAARLRPEAEADLAEARSWYEQQAPGLGDEFVRAFEATLSGLARFPASHPVVHGDMRRAVLRKFPYGVFYVVAPRSITILACLHTARDPRHWKRRT